MGPGDLERAFAARHQAPPGRASGLRTRLRAPLRLGRQTLRALGGRPLFPVAEAVPVTRPWEGPRALASPRPDLTDRETVDEALRIVAGERSVFGRVVRPVSWSADPLCGVRWPRRPSYLIDLAEGRRGADVVTVWELNHLHHLVKLAQAFLLTGEELFAGAFLDEVTRWAAACPPGRGVNWTSPMEVGVRAANVAWALLLVRAHPAWDPRREGPVTAFLGAHREALRADTEDAGAFSNNHHLADMASLVVTSVALGAGAGDAVLEAAAAGLARCMEEQVAADGLHFEDSLAYHCFSLEAFACATLALRTAGLDMPAWFAERLRGMAAALAALSGAPGTFPFIGDSCDARYVVAGSYFRRAADDARPTLALAGAVAGEPPAPAGSVALPATGLYVLRAGRLAATAACMPSGVHGQGGHRHNDLLSFELSVDGVPVVVDPGTYCYLGDLRARAFFRGTAAHNTLLVDGEEQNDIGDPFVLRADHADVTVEAWSATADGAVLEATSRAYGRLGVTHRRRFSLDGRGGELVLEDRVEGAGRHALAWALHFAPGVRLRLEGERAARGLAGGRAFTVAIEDDAAAPLVLEVVDDLVSRAFMAASAARTLRVRAEAAALPLVVRTRITLD